MAFRELPRQPSDKPVVDFKKTGYDSDSYDCQEELNDDNQQKRAVQPEQTHNHGRDGDDDHDGPDSETNRRHPHSLRTEPFPSVEVIERDLAGLS
jgi:hypothetical protein